MRSAVITLVIEAIRKAVFVSTGVPDLMSRTPYPRVTFPAMGHVLSRAWHK